jgi:organic radical activating enzyme
MHNDKQAELVRYPVVEIFDSIQGEGSMIGLPVTFIRLAGCNLTCPWCDSKETWNKPCRHEEIAYDSSYEMRASQMHCTKCGASGTLEELETLTTVPAIAKYKWMSIEQIQELANKEIVVVTGGEPCMHDLVPLFEALNPDHFTCIETNGTLPTPENVGWVVASPKPPEYLIHGQCFFSELKYVVDEEFNTDCIPKDALKNMFGAIWLQPCHYGDGAENEKRTADSWQRCYNLAMQEENLRVGIQMHKMLNVR